MGIYFYTTLLAGIIGLILAVLLAGLQISAKKGLQKYSRARWCMVDSPVTGSILNVVFSVCFLLILISDLIFMTGFNDRAFFYRCFQKVTGKTLREYRDSPRNTH